MRIKQTRQTVTADQQWGEFNRTPTDIARAASPLYLTTQAWIYILLLARRIPGLGGFSGFIALKMWMFILSGGYFTTATLVLN